MIKLILLFSGLNFHNGRNYFFYKKSLEFRKILFGVHILLNTNSL